jgi:acyl carrier protein
MNDHDVHARLRDVFVAVLEEPDLEMNPELRIGDIESWDSFTQINLMLGIEAEFGIEFDSDEIGTLISVGQIRDALQRRLDRAGT